MRIHYLQHVPFEGLGFIADWARSHKHTLSGTELFKGEVFPSGGDYDLLVVMGGPMSVGDEDRYPWLLDEKRFIEQAIQNHRAVLGVCLGAQLVAVVLGARVFRNRHKEIGWFPVSFTDEAQRTPVLGPPPSQVPVFHWHQDTFSLPHGAIRVAQNEACRNQAFVYDRRVLGLQFHLELSVSGLRALIRHCGQDLTEGPFVQNVAELFSNSSRFGVANGVLEEILNQTGDMK